MTAWVLQEWFHEEGLLPMAVSLFSDSEPRVRLKGVLAASCLIRGYAPALVAFCQELQGVAKLLPMVCDSAHNVSTSDARVLA